MGGSEVNPLPSDRSPLGNAPSLGLSPGTLTLWDSTSAPGFLPRSLAVPFNTRSCVLCSCCVLAEQVHFLLGVQAEQLFPMAAFLATA